METTAISLIPPLIVILLVIATRRVIISISAGIIASALILCGFRPGDAVEAVMGAAARIFILRETGILTTCCWCFLSLALGC